MTKQYYQATERIYNDLDKQLQELNVKLNESKDTLQAIYAENGNSDKFKDLLMNECTRFYIKFIVRYQNLYNSISNLFGLTYADTNKKKNADLEILENTSFIKAKVINNSLYIKLPRLPIKIYRRMNLFQDDLQLQLAELAKTGSLPLPYVDKTIYILHVYKKGFDEFLIPDNDNYDFKRYIDIITDYSGNGDSGNKCKFILNTILTDSISDGSYIMVLQGKGEIPEKRIFQNLAMNF